MILSDLLDLPPSVPAYVVTARLRLTLRLTNPYARPVPVKTTRGPAGCYVDRLAQGGPVQPRMISVRSHR